MQHHSRQVVLPSPQLPDSMAAPVRESLKGLRRVLHLGRDMVRDVVEHSPLPAPMGVLARSVLSEVDRVAGHMEGVAVEVARGVLGPGRPVPGQPLVVEEADRRFAAMIKVALGAAVERLGASGARVDEVVIAQLHAGHCGPGARDMDVTCAALLAQGLCRDALQASDDSEAESLPVAAFAVMLWFLSDRTHDDDGLTASIDLSAALASEIRPAITDVARLAGLLTEFRDHV